jgi:hypothetical protein
VNSEAKKREASEVQLTVEIEIGVELIPTIDSLE